jgi:ABC-2 type transport system permease protein
MFKHMLSFELKHRFKKVSTYIYFAMFVLLGFGAIYRGSFGSGPMKFIATAGVGNININSPYALYYLITVMSHFGLLITTAFFGNAAYRDFKENTFALNFSYPISKLDYLSSKYAAAVVSTMFVFSGIGIGAFLTALSPIVNPEKIGPSDLFAAVQPYLIGVLPTILFAGALFFTLVLLTRKFFPVYVGLVGLVIGYSVAKSLAQTQNRLLASLFDPFGQIAAGGITNYWTAAQKNTCLVPLAGNLILNRMLWIALAATLLIFAYRKFRFSHIIESKKQKREAREHKKLWDSGQFSSVKKKASVTQIFHFKNHCHQALATSFLELSRLVKNVYFLIILGLGVALVFLLGFRNVGLIRGTLTYPVTSQVLDTTKNSLYLFSLVIILFCSGELIWRERKRRVGEIYDVLPIPEWVPFMGKLGVIFYVQILIVSIVLASGLIIQLLHGYTHFELGLYVQELFGIRLVYFLFISIFAMFVQILVNKKFLGYILTLFLVDDFLPSIGLEHHLWRVGKTPAYIYSDMNKYSPYVKSIFFYNLYWTAFALLLVVISMLLWIRGHDTRLKHRIKAARARMTRAKLSTAAIGTLSCLILGIFIVYNTNILNTFESTKQVDLQKVDYEKRFKRYDEFPQPRITDITMQVDIYPYKKKARSQGRMVLKNNTSGFIDEIFIQAPIKGQIHKLRLDVPHSLKESAGEHGVYVYTLKNSMKPGQTAVLDFEFELAEKGFKNNRANRNLIKNGTFLYPSQTVPALGYDPYLQHELGDKDKRKKYGLPPKKRIQAIDDEKAKQNTFIKDADWIAFEAMVSTSKDQIALCPGELINEWTEGNRRFFHYKTQRRILKYFAFLSARYQVKKDRWKDVDIAIFYHPDHDYNIDMMIKGVKRSLDYFTANFSPYHYKTVKIVEFPRYALYAEAFPNLIPFSEGYGFIAKFDDTKVEYVFRVTAHEVGHQWWAHQVIGAYVEGQFILTETMAQYSALMVIKKEYTPEKINQYIKLKMDEYLRGRAREREEEVPLIRSNIDVPYINYEKSIVVMNALQEYIGEDSLNRALQKFIQKYAFHGPPYATALEFLECIKEATPENLSYIITDMFETITLYENRALRATCQELEDGRYRVDLQIDAQKFRADGIGRETSVDMNDYIPFGVFGSKNEVLYSAKHWIRSGKNDMSFVVDKKPEKAGIDPSYLLIDKNTDDNIIRLGKGGSSQY